MYVCTILTIWSYVPIYIILSKNYIYALKVEELILTDMSFKKILILGSEFLIRMAQVFNASFSLNNGIKLFFMPTLFHQILMK